MVLFLSSLLPMHDDYLRLCLCSGLGGKVCWWLRNGPCIMGSARCRLLDGLIWFSRPCIHETSLFRIHMLLKRLFIWKENEIGLPYSKSDVFPSYMARENTRIIVSINRDNDSNLLWQKQRKSNSVLDLSPLKTWMLIIFINYKS